MRPIRTELYAPKGRFNIHLHTLLPLKNRILLIMWQPSASLTGWMTAGSGLARDNRTVDDNGVQWHLEAGFKSQRNSAPHTLRYTPLHTQTLKFSHAHSLSPTQHADTDSFPYTPLQHNNHLLLSLSLLPVFNSITAIITSTPYSIHIFCSWNKYMYFGFVSLVLVSIHV